jgi:drug/metabolite transporter (DMT)-like permease
MAAGSQVCGALAFLLAVPFSIPQTPPSINAIACAVALGVFCTGVAYVLYFKLIVDVGPARTLTVTFLAPIFGVIWGQLFLGEPITWSKAAACAIILAGTLLITGFSPRALLAKNG